MSPLSSVSSQSCHFTDDFWSPATCQPYAGFCGEQDSFCICSAFAQLRCECSKSQKEQPTYDLSFPQHRQNGSKKRHLCLLSRIQIHITTPILVIQIFTANPIPFLDIPERQLLNRLLKVKSLKPNQEGCRCCLQAVQLPSCFYTKLSSRIRKYFPARTQIPLSALTSWMI